MFPKSINLLLYPLFREFKTLVFGIKMSNLQIDRENNLNTKVSSGLIFGISCLLIYFLIMLELEIPTDYDFPNTKKKIIEFNKQNIKHLLASFSNVQFSFIKKSIDLIFKCNYLSNQQKTWLEELKILYQSDFSNKEKTKNLLKIFYVYRLTGSNEIAKLEQLKEKRYYYGYRGTSFIPYEDLIYNSSSKVIKTLIKKYANKHFSKRILGIYVCKDHAIQKEIYLHHYFDVKNHSKFYNLSNQTSRKFEYDNTGRVQKLEVNLKRSKAQKNRTKHTFESREKISKSQLARKRSEEETLNRRKRITDLNQKYVVCPYCQKTVQKVAAKRWHFDNCLKNPSVLINTLIAREKMRQRMITYNKLKKKD
uniref:Putative GIY-YIG homing endonuclease n=1 Tax=Jenufa minuta TaxID=993092 RepID=A0A0S2LNN2_JENMI|nr:putative GIY-YIG homing endonuclease [Jenufa minuta]ALO63009.1 putative GIY-YIG homing endonuclease [Jenufa minuta]